MIDLQNAFKYILFKTPIDSDAKERSWMCSEKNNGNSSCEQNTLHKIAQLHIMLALKKEALRY
jgi:hypothetical protein